MRFYPTATAPETRDAEACPGRFEGSSWEDSVERNNPVLSRNPEPCEGANEEIELVVTWGNLANRMLSFAYESSDGKMPQPVGLDAADRERLAQSWACFQIVSELHAACKLRAALGRALAPIDLHSL